MTWSTACIVPTAFLTHLWCLPVGGPIRLQPDPTGYETSQSEAIERARADFDAGHYAQALRLLEPVTNADIYDATAHYWLGRAQEGTGAPVGSRQRSRPTPASRTTKEIDAA